MWQLKVNSLATRMGFADTGEPYWQLLFLRTKNTIHFSTKHLLDFAVNFFPVTFPETLKESTMQV